MGIFGACILMMEKKENVVTGYAIVLSSYYHIKSTFDQNTIIVLNLMTGRFV